MFFQGLCPDKNQQQKKEHRNNKRQKLETEEGDVQERKYKTGYTKSLEGRPK